jgi:hypothetical protein
MSSLYILNKYLKRAESLREMALAPQVYMDINIQA